MAENTPLQALIVSRDKSVLQEVSWVLSAVGYSVKTSKDFDADALWRRYGESDIVLIDGREANCPHEPLMVYESENPTYWILLYDSTVTTDFSAWYAVGGHDALRIPISRGELLARLRAGARYLEFERRLRSQSAASPVAGLHSRSGILRRLRKLSAQRTEDSAFTLVATAIDWYSGIRRKKGTAASRRLVESVGRALKRNAAENAIVAYLGDGQFVTLLAGQSLKSARASVDQLVKDFGVRESQRETIARPTLTMAIVPWSPGQTPEELLSAGADSLRIAQQSGGNCIVEEGEYSKELSAWQEEISTGNPFSSVVVQDIMESFPAILRVDADQSAIVDALRRSRVPVCPYVDGKGKLVGVASAAETPWNGTDPNAPAVLAISEPVTVPVTATFPEIYETFSSQGCSTLIVVADGAPVGYLTCNGFLSLIEPIGLDSFAPSDAQRGDTRDLVVAAEIDSY